MNSGRQEVAKHGAGAVSAPGALASLEVERHAQMEDGSREAGEPSDHAPNPISLAGQHV